VALGNNGSYTLTVGALNGFSGSVGLSVSGLPTGVTATFTPATVSGAGTSNLVLMVGAGTAPGTYALTVTGSSGSLSQTASLNLVVISGISGTLSGVLSAPSGTQNLTSLGSSDWADWGLSSAASYNHKASGGGQISNYTVQGYSAAFSYNTNPFGFTWTDGTPTATATDSTTGVYVSGEGNGFQITAPADTTPRTLTVYVGVWSAQGKIVAHLSDGSAPDYVDSSLNNANATSTGLYSFTYQASSSGQTLTVTYTQANSTVGNVTLQAATLVGSATPSFTLSASPTTNSVALGNNGSYTLTVGALNGFSGSVGLSVSGLPTGVTATFTPATVSGAGTSNLVLMVGAGTAPGTYALTVTGSSGSLSQTASLNLVVISGISGTLSGVLSAPSGTQNLTSLGSSDWADWGLSSAASYNHKASGGGQISNYTVQGYSAAFSYNTNPFGFTWTDGTPTATATDSTTGVYVSGEGNGFQITAPADTTPRTLTVYVGVWSAQGKIVAHLSDGSAPDYVDSSLNNASATTTGLYTFTYEAGSSGQTLTVTFTQVNNTVGNVTLQAATLASP
jgi:hypothetical protein